jgi:hypothetical protein
MKRLEMQRLVPFSALIAALFGSVRVQAAATVSVCRDFTQSHRAKEKNIPIIKLSDFFADQCDVWCQL